MNVECPKCGERFTVADERADGEAAARPEPDGAGDCPKCGEPFAPGAPACRRCGLDAERFATFREDVQREAPDDAVAAWQRCLVDWEDAAAHERFAQAVAVAGAYAYAAQCYRVEMRRRPGDAIAAARLAEVGRRAEAGLLRAVAAGRYREEPSEPFRKVAVLLAFLIALLAAAVFYALFLHQTTQATSQPVGPGRALPRSRLHRPAGPPNGPRGPNIRSLRPAPPPRGANADAGPGQAATAR